MQREAGRVSICFSGLADDYVVVKGDAEEVQARIVEAFAS